MPDPGEYTHREILSQPEVWAQSLARTRAAAGDLTQLWRQAACSQVVFTGCGSTYYLSMAAAAFTQAVTGVPARAYPASELWFNPALAQAPGGKTLFIAVSRSAKTSETYNAMQAFRKLDAGPVLTISCYPSESWSQLSDVHLLLPEAQEESLAQTRSFASMYLAVQRSAAGWAGAADLAKSLERLPEICRRLLDQGAAVAQKLGREATFDRFYFLGSGIQYGLACELSLKMKEMSLSHSEPFHFMEFRHGPKAMAGKSALIVGLLSEAYGQHERKVLEEMRGFGASVLDLGEQGAAVSFASDLPELARSVLYLPAGQLLAYEHAIARGLNPDRIQNLKAVVEL